MTHGSNNGPLLPCVDPAGGRPFWTVIIPVYERTQFLGQCLSSVLDQAPPAEEMEIIVHDNCSRTDLRPVVESLGRGRVRFERTSSNCGMYGNFNQALGKSRGLWIHILHDDDFVMPGFYGVLRKGLERQGENIQFGCCHYTNVREPQGPPWSPPLFRGDAGVLERFIERLAMANPLNMPAVVFRRTVFEQMGMFREDLPYTGDWEFYARASVRFGWWYQPENLARYRVHAGQMTTSLARSGETAVCVRRTLEAIEEYLGAEPARGLLQQAREFHGKNFATQAWDALNANNAALGLVLLRECLSLGGAIPATDTFFRMLQHPSAGPVREELIRAWGQAVKKG